MLNHIVVFGICEVHLARIHLEDATIVRSIDIFWSEVEMQVRELVAIGTIVDLRGIECLLHGTGHTRHICHKGIAVFIGEFVEVVHMVLIGHKTTTAIGLFLKQERPRHGQLSKLNHQVVERLVIGAVETLLRITLHITCSPGISYHHP